MLSESEASTLEEALNVLYRVRRSGALGAANDERELDVELDHYYQARRAVEAITNILRTMKPATVTQFKEQEA